MLLYTVTKEIEVAGAHQLNLDYDSPCKNLHGHNWHIKITCQSEKLNNNGMVIDFKKIKKIVSQLDHAYINDVIKCNPTAENIGIWLLNNIPHCIKVEVQESDGNIATIQSI